MNIGNWDSYREAIVKEYRDETFRSEYEARRKLWKCVIIILKYDPKPDAAIEQLLQIATGVHGVKTVSAFSTVQSARDKFAAEKQDSRRQALGLGDDND